MRRPPTSTPERAAVRTVMSPTGSAPSTRSFSMVMLAPMPSSTSRSAVRDGLRPTSLSLSSLFGTSEPATRKKEAPEKSPGTVQVFAGTVCPGSTIR